MPSLTQLFPTTNQSICNQSYNLLKLYHGTLNITTEFFNGYIINFNTYPQSSPQES